MTPDLGSSHPVDSPAVILLERGYATTTMDGQLVAVPLNPDSGDATCVPAIVDGQATAVPVFDVSGHLDAMGKRLAERREPAAANLSPAPAPVVGAAVEQGLPLAVRQYLLYGSIASLAAGGAVWMLGAAVATVAPHADELGDLLKWCAILVGLVMLGAAALLGKLRSLTAGTATAGTAASGDGASATGTVLALVHRQHTTTIGRQSAGWRGSITNNTG
ncbi:hypothetical protein [Streptomyces sp. TLI_171]|uniref:hypothetical protein n=1 Tax=Streptomyces sp. TLI_171 TaxID=1938859 RepID=UPI000C193613|nr:hypothetical protein [Streptomyces sp. TLI_171]RKE02935.1 hypothetical protein BX266_7538 [Streptomyces sp. TLI_171]